MLGSAFRFPVSRRTPSPLLLAPLGWEGQALVADVDGRLHCWGTRIGALLWSEIPASLRSTCHHLAWTRSATGDVLVLGAADEGLLVWNGTSGLPVAPPGGEEPETGLWAVTAGTLPGGGVLVAGAGDDADVHRWDLRAGRRLPPLTGHDDSVSAVLLVAPPGERPMIVSGDDSGVILRWDALSGERLGAPLHLPDGAESSTLPWLVPSVLPDGRILLAAAHDTGVLYRWDAATGAPFGDPIRLPEEDGERPAVLSLSAFSHDDVPVLLVCLQDRPLQAWNAATGALLGGTPFPVSAAVAARNPDGKLMLALDLDGGEALVLPAAEALALRRGPGASRPMEAAR